MALALHTPRAAASSDVVTGVSRLLARLLRRLGPASQPFGAALIVGGDAGQRRFCEALLQALGLRVDVATNGCQALQALGRGSFGLVIVDGAAPDLDASFWARLRALAATPGSPRLYVVTDRKGGRLHAASAAAAVRAMPRPVRALSLVEAAQGLR
jgi:CheY-like chemotaxis protein